MTISYGTWCGQKVLCPGARSDSETGTAAMGDAPGTSQRLSKVRALNTASWLRKPRLREVRNLPRPLSCPRRREPDATSGPASQQRGLGCACASLSTALSSYCLVLHPSLRDAVDVARPIAQAEKPRPGKQRPFLRSALEPQGSEPTPAPVPGLPPPDQPHLRKGHRAFPRGHSHMHPQAGVRV